MDIYQFNYSLASGRNPPIWLKRWIAGALRFIEHERGALPFALMTTPSSEQVKRSTQIVLSVQYGLNITYYWFDVDQEICMTHDYASACMTARGVVEQRASALIGCLSTIRYKLLFIKSISLWQHIRIT